MKKKEKSRDRKERKAEKRRKKEKKTGARGGKSARKGKRGIPAERKARKKNDIKAIGHSNEGNSVQQEEAQRTIRKMEGMG